MKVFLISSALVLLSLAIVVPLTEGFKCYICVGGDGAEKLDGYHKNCNKGELPESHAEICTPGNTLDEMTQKPLSHSEFQTMQVNHTFACAKARGRKDIAEKFCTLQRPNRTDWCFNQHREALDDQHVLDGIFCICHKEKCNGAGDNKIKQTAVFSTALFAILFKLF